MILELPRNRINASLSGCPKGITIYHSLFRFSWVPRVKLPWTIVWGPRNGPWWACRLTLNILNCKFSNDFLELCYGNPLKWLYHAKCDVDRFNLLEMWLLKYYVPFPVSDSRSNSDSLIVNLHFWFCSTQFYGFLLRLKLHRPIKVNWRVDNLLIRCQNSITKKYKNPQNDQKFNLSVLFIQYVSIGLTVINSN